MAKKSKTQTTKSPLITKTVVTEPDSKPNVEPISATATSSTAHTQSVSAHQSSQLMKGLMFMLTASLLLSFQNVVTRVLLSPKSLFGFWGDSIPSGPNNSLLILVIRIGIVLPIMAFIVGPRIYKNTWKDLKELPKIENRSRLYSTLGSGACLFVSQFLMYIALGSVPAGVATTIFFIYPTVTIFLLWGIFKEKPSLLLLFAIFTIYIGGFMTIPQANFVAKTGVDAKFLIGALCAAGSGTAFAGYIILIRLAKLHPAPFTIVTFSTILFFGLLILPLFTINIDERLFAQLAGGSIVLAATTLLGYLFTNFGVPLVGPAFASVISASGPAVTAIMALALIGETLELYQILGIVLVSTWVLGISVENVKKQSAPK